MGGCALAGLLALIGAWGIRDEEIPGVALLTAVFFVASLISVPVPGDPKTQHFVPDPSIHLLGTCRHQLSLGKATSG